MQADLVYLQSETERPGQQVGTWAVVFADSQTGGIGGSILGAKGDERAVAELITFLRVMGVTAGDFILRCDAEPLMAKVCRRALTDLGQPEARLQVAPRHSHQSQGLVERAIRSLQEHIRIQLSQHHAEFGERLRADGVVFAWLVRHSFWLLNRFGRGVSVMEQPTGRPERSELFRFGTHVMAQTARSAKLAPSG